MTTEEIDQSNWAGNIGSRMPVDVIGLDIDAYKGGLITFNDLIARLGPLPDTWISHSGRNDQSGIRFYRVPITVWVFNLPGIEIIQRGHRYACLFPSMHPDGRRYGWWDQAEAGPTNELPLVEDLPELPWSWIGELSRPNSIDRSSRSTAADHIGTLAFLTTHEHAEQPTYLTVIVDHFKSQWSNGSSRHDSMQHCLIWAMEMARAGVINASEAKVELSYEWTMAVAPNERRMELESDRRVTEFEAMLRHAVGKATAKDQAAINKLHDDYVGITMNPGVTKQQTTDSQLSTEEERPNIFIDWEAFINRDATVNRWLVEGFWPWGRAMALWAGAKEGKSELALWCACKMALGEHPWTGRAIEPIKVAYFDYEMNEDDLEERLDAFDVDPLRLVGSLHYAQFPPILPLDNEQGGIEFEAMVMDLSVQAVVIDTFGRAVKGDENEADTVRDFYRYTGIRLKRRLIGYLRTDHSGKDPTKGQRGSSAKRDDVDVIWSQRRTSTNGVLLDCSSSSRLSWVGPTLKLDRVTVGDTIAYATPIQMGGWTLPAMHKATELDALSLPLDVSKRDAIAALKAAGKPQGKGTVLIEALRYRRERPITSLPNGQIDQGTTKTEEQGTSDREPEGTTSNQTPSDLLFLGEPPLGTTREPLSAPVVPPTPSKGGGTGEPPEGSGAVKNISEGSSDGGIDGNERGA
jgi:hypothetical protein